MLSHKKLNSKKLFLIEKGISGLNISSEHRLSPAKGRVMSDESYFKTDTNVRYEAEICFITYRDLKTQNHSVSMALFCSTFTGVSG